MRNAEEWRDYLGWNADDVRWIVAIQLDAIGAAVTDWDDGVPYCRLCKHAMDRTVDYTAVVGTCASGCYAKALSEIEIRRP